MSDLVEAVARELCKLEVAMGDPPSVVKQAVDEQWPYFTARARYSIAAVLDAIAEPSEAQLDAVENHAVGCCNAAPGDLTEIYRAMIAALRKELTDV